MSWLAKLLNRSKSSSLPPEALHQRISLSPLFKDVPDNNIAEMLSLSQLRQASEGEEIVRQGEDGDNYYIVLDGMVSVMKRGDDGSEKAVAVLAPGYSFGEEALISYRKRNATVKMETDGLLLSVPKQAFIDYLMTSLVAWLTPYEAQMKINSGAVWMDVRPKEDYVRSHLPQAISLPLEELHDRLGELDRETHYICCCPKGRLSATAAFIMRQHGFNASVLQGGLERIERRR